MTVKPLISAHDLASRAKAQRKQNLELIYNTGMGHIGGDMSATDILITLYFAILNIDPRKPNDPARDRFIMSKGHCSGALYSTLANRGFFPVEDLKTYMQPLSKLNGHPDRNKIPGVETNTGPLGHGLPVAVGTAIGAKLGKQSWRTYVLTGDGELQEGSNWEAAMLAGHRGLDNLTVIIDRNRLQQGDWVEATNNLEPLADKWRAFGWSVSEIDGHDYDALLETFHSLPLEKGKPSCIVAHTHKGNGISFMQDHPGWHHRVPTEAELTEALQELGEKA
ncbi:MAG: transketolase [Trueperaceae bacterium]|nr:transketolase [Trueperaceae bacterium]